MLRNRRSLLLWAALLLLAWRLGGLQKLVSTVQTGVDAMTGRTAIDIAQDTHRSSPPLDARRRPGELSGVERGTGSEEPPGTRRRRFPLVERSARRVGPTAGCRDAARQVGRSWARTRRPARHRRRLDARRLRHLQAHRPRRMPQHEIIDGHRSSTPVLPVRTRPASAQSASALTPPAAAAGASRSPSGTRSRLRAASVHRAPAP